MVFGATLAAQVATYFSGAARTAQEPEPFPDLTDREREVLGLLAAGRSNDAIAGELYVSNKTVRNAVSAIYAKLHAAGRAEAIITAREAGYGKGRRGRDLGGGRHTKWSLWRPLRMTSRRHPQEAHRRQQDHAR